MTRASQSCLVDEPVGARPTLASLTRARSTIRVIVDSVARVDMDVANLMFASVKPELDEGDARHDGSGANTVGGEFTSVGFAQEKPTGATGAANDEGGATANGSVSSERDVALRGMMRVKLGLDVGTDGGFASEGDGDTEALKPKEEEEEEAATTTVSQEATTTQRQLVERRLKRMRELRALYRDQYFVLMEELRRKHRRFELERGHGGSREAESEASLARETLGLPKACVVDGCNARPMPCAHHCFAHITLDGEQKLYRRAAP